MEVNLSQQHLSVVLFVLELPSVKATKHWIVMFKILNPHEGNYTDAVNVK